MTAPNGNGRPSQSPNFGDRLTEAVADGSPRSFWASIPTHCKLWPAAVEATSEARARLASTLSEAEDAAGGVGDATSGPSAAGVVSRLETAAAVLAHCRALIDAAGPACVAVKPQLACFERLGAPGWLALEHVCEHARERGLLVLADGKRGDVPVTAAAYAQALVDSTPSPFGPVSGLGADAFTANPLLGRDALEPLVATARSSVRRASSCSSARPTLAQQTSSTSSSPPANACGSGSHDSSTSWDSRARPGSPTSAPSPARPSPSTSRACAS